MEGWDSLGEGSEYGVGAVSWGEEGEVQFFAVRPDGQVWSRYWDGEAWHEWHEMGGRFVSRPAASARDANRIDVFGVAEDGSVRHQWWNGSEWVAWETVEGAPSPATAVECSWSGDRLDLFVIGPGGEVWYRALPA